MGGDKAAQAGMERPDVVVLQVHLNKGFPVVVAFVQMNFVQLVAGKVQVFGHAEMTHFFGNVAACVLKHQAIPSGGFVAVQVQAGVNLKVRRTYQLARCVVGPSVQWAHDIAAGVAASLQHGGLAVTADVGDQLNTACVAYQCPAFAFVQRFSVNKHKSFIG